MVHVSEALYWVPLSLGALCQPFFIVLAWRAFQDAGGIRRIGDIACRATRCCASVNEGAGQSAGSDIQHTANELLGVRRVALARRTLWFLWSVLCILWWMEVIEFSVSPDAASEDTSSFKRRLLILLALVSTTVGVLFKGELVTQRTLPAWLAYGTVVATLILLLPPVEDAECFLHGWPCVVLFTLTFGGICLRLELLVFASFCINTGLFVGYARSEVNVDRHGLSSSALQAFGIWLWQCALFHWAEMSMVRSAHKEMETEYGKCQESAMSVLLGSVCDAVVDLDSNLVMKEHVGKLAGLLMHGVDKTLQGSPLTDFIQQGEDQKRFHEMVKAYPVDLSDEPMEQPSHKINLRMRDAAGRFFDVIMYHVPYLSIHGRTQHLIGLQDASDASQQQVRGSHRQPPLPEAELSPGVASALAGGIGSSGESGEPMARMISNSSNASGQEDLGSVVVLAEQGLAILACTPVLADSLMLDGSDASLAALLEIGGRLEERLLDLAARVRAQEVRPHTASFGKWLVTLPSWKGDAKRAWCTFVAEFPAPEAAPSEGQAGGEGATDDEFQLIKLTLMLHSIGQSNDWRNREGPLLASAMATTRPVDSGSCTPMESNSKVVKL